jgi:hypothetical protein
MRPLCPQDDVRATFEHFGAVRNVWMSSSGAPAFCFLEFVGEFGHNSSSQQSAVAAAGHPPRAANSARTRVLYLDTSVIPSSRWRRSVALGGRNGGYERGPHEGPHCVCRCVQHALNVCMWRTVLRACIARLTLVLAEAYTRCTTAHIHSSVSNRRTHCTRSTSARPRVRPRGRTPSRARRRHRPRKNRTRRGRARGPAARRVQRRRRLIP